MNWQRIFNFLRLYAVEILACAALFLILYQWDLSWFNTHMSRDFMRALNWRHVEFDSWLGPELGDDYKRLPGPAYYILLAPLTGFSSLLPAVAAKAVFTVSLVYLFLREVRKHYADIISIIAPLLLISPLFIFTSRNFWNPSLVIALNCLQMLLMIRFLKSGQSKWLILSFVTFAAAVQIHFSTIYIYLSFIATVLLSDVFSKKQRQIGLGSFILSAVYLGIWYQFNRVPEFDRQISQFFGLPQNFSSRLSDISMFVSLSDTNFGDYNLFTLFLRALDRLGHIDYGTQSNVLTAYSTVMSILFFGAIPFAFIRYKKRKDPIFLFSFIHVLLFVIMGFLTASNREHLPYRYGLALYPVQLFLLTSFLAGLVEKFGNKVNLMKYALAAFAVSYYCYFYFQMLDAQAITGRTHNTIEDNLEMTIRNKLKIYSEISAEKGRDPFTYLHGRTMNRFRLKEFDWYHRQAYFSLYRFAKNDVPNLSADQASLPPAPGRFIALKNMSELKTDDSDSLKTLPVTVEQLPQNLKITYHRPDGSLIDEMKWNNSSLILPLIKRDPSAEIKTVRLHFEVDASAGRYLNILMNSSEKFHWAYATVFARPEFTIDGSPRNADFKYNGNFLVQSQFIFDLGPEQKVHKVEIAFKPGVKYATADRIDIFLMKDVLPQEELFVSPGQNK